MPITVQPEGDDQAWKKDVARAIAEIEKTLFVLKSQINNAQGGGNVG